MNEPTPEPAAALVIDDLTIPEGFELDETLSNDFLGILNNSEMDPKERANALIDLHKKTVEAALEKDSQSWDDMQTSWKEESQNDPDIGGAKLQPTLTNIAKLIDEYGSDELKGVMDLTGAGNNVHVIKFLSKIAAKLTEPPANPGNPTGNPDGMTAAQRLFPSMKG